MKILQLCHKMPFPQSDGGSFSLFSTADGLLRAGADVRVLAMNPSRCQVARDRVPQPFGQQTGFLSVPVDTRLSVPGALLNFFTRRSYFVERFRSSEFDHALSNILSAETFDIVQLEHIYLCLFIDTIRKQSAAKIILRPQNVESDLWSGYLENVRNPLKRGWLRMATKRLQAFEQVMSGKADGILAIAPDDAGAFRRFAPGKPVETVPPGIDFEIMNRTDPEKQYRHFPRFYHIGSMDWRPNLEGIGWFLDEVLPYITGIYPEFLLRLAGKKMPNWLHDKEGRNLAVDGEVTDSQAYQEDKAVMVVPLLSGSGIRIKIIEAMAMGKTVISTSIGARGIPYSNGENILIADTKEQFAEQIGRCMGSAEFCRKIGNSARELAFRHYDRAANADRMIAFYKMITKLTR